MKIKTYILFTVLLVGSPALADPTASREYQVKAAFLYNFIQFVDWPKEKMGDGNEPIIIGVIGKDPFGDAFDPIVDKEIHGKKLLVKRFMAFEELKKTGEKDKSLLDREIESLRKCHLLFICSSEDKSISEILNSVKDHSVLTIGEVQGFLEAGGIVNFVMEEKKVRFEISITAAKGAKLKIRSQLLRLAKRVVGEDSGKGNKNG
ncbi:MAG: YfiR family protein [Sedimentisphaerales bacterium]|nr:YfiR family protein [Sedimentisphaerales bacterium]